MFGLRIWPEGSLNLIFWLRAGVDIGALKRFVDQGLVELACTQSNGGRGNSGGDDPDLGS
jgi:hypothetical protein